VIVVDCSSIVDALSGVSGVDSLRSRVVDEELHAPTLLDYEVVSVVRGLALGGHLTAQRADELLADYGDLPLHRWSSAHALRRRAFALRDSLSAYDAAYVVLAEALECPLLTRDARLARAGGHEARIEVL
jgi:predicted nucleic acid-binding protein